MHHHVICSDGLWTTDNDPGETRNSQPDVSQQQSGGVVAPQAFASDQSTSDVIADQPERHEQHPNPEDAVTETGPQQRGNSAQGKPRTRCHQGGNGTAPHGQLCQLGAFGGDRDNDEPGEQGQQRGNLYADQQRGRETRQDCSHHLGSHQRQRGAAIQSNHDSDESQCAIEQQQLPEHREHPGDHHESPRAEEGRGCVGKPIAQRLGTFQRDQGSHESQDHERPVQVSKPTVRHRRPDTEPHQSRVEACQKADSRQHHKEDAARHGSRCGFVQGGQLRRSSFSFQASGPSWT